VLEIPSRANPPILKKAKFKLPLCTRVLDKGFLYLFPRRAIKISFSQYQHRLQEQGIFLMRLFQSMNNVRFVRLLKKITIPT
jgi:hypothetical protein